MKTFYGRWHYMENKITRNIKDISLKLTKTGFFYIFGSSVINQIITFLSGIILIRVLSKAEFGVFSYANNIMSLFLLFSGIGMISGILQVCSEKFNDPKQALSIFKYGAKVAIGFNMILSLLIICFATSFPLAVDGANFILLIMCIVPILIIGYDLIQIYFRYNRLNKNYSYFTTTNTLIILTFTVVGAVLAKVIGLVFLRYFGYVITILIGIILFKFPFRKFKSVGVLKKKEKKDLLKLSLVSMANNTTGQLILILDIFIIGLMIPNETIIATYKVATIIPNALIFIPSALMIYVYPYFATHQQDKQWVKKNFTLLIKFFGLFNFFLTTLLIIFAPFIIKILFGYQYLDAVGIFRILVLSYFFSATFRKVVGNLLVTQRKLKFNFWLGVFEGVINIIGNLIFIYYFGPIGAAITSLIIVLLSSLIGVTYFLKVIKKI
jgi:O-antigen/teichoic acid export membrane protein